MTIEECARLWCQFVLNEGIMPAPVLRMLKSARQWALAGDYERFVAILLECGGSNVGTVRYEIKNVIRFAMGGDPDLTKWLAKMREILLLIYMTDKTTFPDVIIGAMVSFIKNCPLVDEKQKQKYLWGQSPSKNKRHRKSNKYTTGQAEEFGEFLLRKGYSYGTACSYKSAISYIAKNWCPELWEVKDFAEVQKIKELLDGNAEYLEADKNKHSSLSNGFARYCEFLENN